MISMVPSNAGIRSKELSPMKDAPPIESIDSERIMRSVQGSLEKLPQDTIKKIL